MVSMLKNAPPMDLSREKPLDLSKKKTSPGITVLKHEGNIQRNNNIYTSDYVNARVSNTQSKHLDNADFINQTFFGFNDSYIGNETHDIIEDIIMEKGLDHNNNQSVLDYYTHNDEFNKVATINGYVSVDYSEVSFSNISVASTDYLDIDKISNNISFTNGTIDSVRTNAYKDTEVSVEAGQHVLKNNTS